MTSRGLLALAVALAAVFLGAGSAGAGEIIRKVERGESLSLICKEVYGDKELYAAVGLYNGKDDPRTVRVGEALKLPWSETVTLGKGESLSARARRVWGDAKLYPVLAWANGIVDPARVEAGTRLLVPVLLPYRLARGESVSAVAGRFYGDPKQFGPILTASGVHDPSRLPAGTPLKIPYIFPKPRQRAKAKPQPAAISANKTEALDLLERAGKSFRAGDFGRAGEEAREAAGSLAGKDKARALRLTAACHYAFEETDAAVKDLAEAHRLDPEFTPDPAYVNPEMRALYERASGK